MSGATDGDDRAYGHGHGSSDDDDLYVLDHIPLHFLEVGVEAASMLTPLPRRTRSRHLW